MTGSQALLKTLWHVALAAAAAFEAVTAETKPRKLLAGSDDFKDFREARRYEGNS